MNASYLFTFSEHGFCGVFTQNGQFGQYSNIPVFLQASFEDTEVEHVLWVAIGPNNSWFLSWIDKDENSWFSSVNLPEDLDAWLRKDLTQDEVIGLRVFLGPDGQSLAHSPSKGFYSRLDEGSDLRYEYEHRTREPHLDKDPSIIAFGMHHAWVVVGAKGDLMWDLKGHYQELDKILSDSEYGIEHVALSLWNTTHYFVVFTDGSAKYHTDQKLSFMDNPPKLPPRH